MGVPIHFITAFLLWGLFFLGQTENVVIVNKKTHHKILKRRPYVSSYLLKLTMLWKRSYLYVKSGCDLRKNFSPSRLYTPIFLPLNRLPSHEHMRIRHKL